MKIILAIILALALPAAAQQITPNSVCGEEATGKRPDNNVVVTHKAGNMWVNEQGFWALCPTVHNGPPPAPRDCLPEGGRTWEQDGSYCSTTQSGYGSGVPALRHGQSTVLTADVGPTRGALGLRCVDGRLQETGSSCNRAVTCPARTRIQYGSNGACTVTVDARQTPTLGAILALPADPSSTHTGSAILRCEFGGWSFVESPSCTTKDTQ